MGEFLVESNNHGRPEGGNTGICPPLEIESKNQHFLENLKPAA